jgi:hypothetical protein
LIHAGAEGGQRGRVGVAGGAEDPIERIGGRACADRQAEAGDKLTKKGERSLEIAVLAWGEVENEWAKLLGGPAAMQEVREAMFAFIEKYGDWHRGEQPRLRPVW